MPKFSSTPLDIQPILDVIPAPLDESGLTDQIVAALLANDPSLDEATIRGIINGEVTTAVPETLSRTELLTDITTIIQDEVSAALANTQASASAAVPLLDTRVISVNSRRNIQDSYVTPAGVYAIQFGVVDSGAPDPNNAPVAVFFTAETWADGGAGQATASRRMLIQPGERSPVFPVRQGRTLNYTGSPSQQTAAMACYIIEHFANEELV